MATFLVDSLVNSSRIELPDCPNVKDYRYLLHPVIVQDLVKSWLKEDTPNFDYGGFVVGEKIEKAVLLCKSDCVLAGAPFVDAIFSALGCSVDWSYKEGVALKTPCSVAHVTGKVRNILLGERVALNSLTRMSGIATYARKLKEITIVNGWKGEIAGTRKTTPGFRLPEKYALQVGNISTHRYDLSSMIMLKDNHIWSAGNIKRAVEDAKSVGGFSMKIEVECRSLKDALEAGAAGCDIVMLDNFKAEVAHETAKALKEKYPNIVIEASGGITDESISSYFSQYVDVISLSRTTQGYNCSDFSLKILKQGIDPNNPLVLKDKFLDVLR